MQVIRDNISVKRMTWLQELNRAIAVTSGTTAPNAQSILGLDQASID